MRSRHWLSRKGAQARNEKSAKDGGGRDVDEKVDVNEEDEDQEQDRFVYDDESAWRALGDRYDEFKTRFEHALNDGNLDDILGLAADFGDTKFPASGNF